MGTAETKEGEAVEPHGAVLAQRLPDARLKLFRLWGMYQSSTYTQCQCAPMCVVRGGSEVL